MPGGHTDYKKWDALDVSDDEEDVARKKMAKLRDEMSEKEQRRLNECMTQPEFRSLLQEYQEEISDPKNREEQEVYLQQVEREAREGRDASVPGVPGTAPPAGQQLIKPSKGFVVKTWLKHNRQKVFINVVHHADIAPPTSQPARAPDGRMSESWQLPHIMSPAAKVEKDAAGHECTAYDVCFHTEVLRRGEVHEAWRKMVGGTAVDSVQRLHKLEFVDDEWKLPKLRYFGNFGQGPSVLTHNKAAHDAKAEERAREAAAVGSAGAGAGDTARPPPPAAPAPPAPPPSKPAATAPSAPPAPRAAPSPPAPSAAAGRAHAAGGPETPKHTLVHSGTPVLSDSFNDPRLAPSTRPARLVLKVELPKLASARTVELTISARAVQLRDEDGLYALAVELPYDVDEDGGSAKWDKVKRMLAVTLPVLAPPPAPPADARASSADAEAEAAAEAFGEAAEAAASEAAAEARAAREQREREAEREQLRAAAAAALAAELNDSGLAGAAAEPACDTNARGPAGTGSSSPAPPADGVPSPGTAERGAADAASPLGSPVSDAPASADDAHGGTSSEDGDLVVINPGDVPSAAGCAPDFDALLARAEPAGYEMRQNEQNVTMVVDVEGARRDSARLQLSTAEVCVLVESARGWHVARTTLAHDIVPAESRLEVHGDFVLVIMRKAVHKAWDVCERDELTPFARSVRSPSADERDALRPAPSPQGASKEEPAPSAPPAPTRAPEAANAPVSPTSKPTEPAASKTSQAGSCADADALLTARAAEPAATSASAEAKPAPEGAAASPEVHRAARSSPSAPTGEARGAVEPSGGAISVSPAADAPQAEQTAAATAESAGLAAGPVPITADSVKQQPASVDSEQGIAHPAASRNPAAVPGVALSGPAQQAPVPRLADALLFELD